MDVACQLYGVSGASKCRVHENVAVLEADYWQVREGLGAETVLVVWVRGHGLLQANGVDDIVVVGAAHAQPGDGEA
jgi:hypothetical protein